MSASLLFSVTACNTVNASVTSTNTTVEAGNSDEINNYNDGEHAIEVSGKTAEYSNVKVNKTGSSSSGDEADFYGENSAIFATDKATLTLSGITVNTDGKHANAVFSYGEGTTVNISDSTITTSGDCSGGLMTTGGGTMNASNLTIHTTGNSSAAIRSDRGGGTVNVDGGTYTTDGQGSPAIYSTADITVSNATLESTSSQGVVVEGKNSVTLKNVKLIADNNTQNSDKSSYYQAVMIYQSMSGDASVGLAAFTMSGGSLTNKKGDVFFVNNTTATITLENVEIVNNDSTGVFLRACAAGWGSEGSNGGKVNLYLNKQTQCGDIVVDSVSVLNMYMASSSTYTGAINADNKGQVYVEIESGSKWVLTGDSYVTSLTCGADAIDLNGHKLYVNGVEYKSGTASTGTAIEIKTESSGTNGQPDGMPGEPPSGEKPQGDPPSGDPPSGGPGGNGEKPQGDPPSGDPPSGAPGGNNNNSGN
jgi:ribosomal protein L24